MDNLYFLLYLSSASWVIQSVDLIRCRVLNIYHGGESRDFYDSVHMILWRGFGQNKKENCSNSAYYTVNFHAVKCVCLVVCRSKRLPGCFCPQYAVVFHTASSKIRKMKIIFMTSFMQQSAHTSLSLAANEYHGVFFPQSPIIFHTASS